MKVLLSALLMGLIAAPLAAQGWIEPPPHRRPEFGVTKVRTVVSVRVTGRVAAIEVEEWFRNEGGGLGEGDYLYPLPGEAVFSNFSLFQGDEELRGETMDAAQARAIYEEIVRRKRDPALIELAGHGLIRARVFPIGPGETRKITLRYTQVLRRSGDGLQFRYAAGGRTGRSSLEGVTGLRPQQGAPVPLAFTLWIDNANEFRDPFSPTHQVDVTRDDGTLRVRPRGELNGDFSLFLPFARSVVGITLATHRASGEDGYFMLTLSPGRPDGRTVPRDVTIVLDVSGSMSGSKLDQAKAALHQLLGSLERADRFRLIAFSSSVRTHAATWSGAGAGDLRSARHWVDGLSADGGTNIAGALEEAFRVRTSAGRLPIVVFLTDGLPSVGERNPERIAAQAEADRGGVRVFAFGVGHDVNTYLLDRLSAAGRGSTQYVQPGEDVEVALGMLAAKIRHPVLTDLEIADAPVELTEIYPSTLPDLFAGEELIVFGRYRGTDRARTGAVAIRGRRDDRHEQYRTQVTFPVHQLDNDFIPRLWASRKIGVLAREIRLGGPNPELEEEIRRTALRYGLLSEYTSYLVQEPQDVANVPAGAPPRRSAAMPSTMVGARAVAAAEQARARREAKSTLELEAADEVLLGRGHVGQARHVAGRLFKDQNGVWTDLQHDSARRVVRIAAFSDAYFAVLAALPELKPYVTEFGSVIVSGDRVAIHIDDAGTERLSAQAVQRLVREFRAR